MARLVILSLCLVVRIYGQFTNPNPMSCGVPVAQPNLSQVAVDVIPNTGSWPWVALVMEPNGVIFNSASFIHPHVILSSAQHFASAGWSHIPHLRYWRVYPAATNISMRHPVGRYYHIDKVVVHPQYHPANLDNDVALAFLEEAVQWNNHTRPACLPDSGQQYAAGDSCFLPFYKTMLRDGSHLQLNQVSLPILDERTCHGFYSDMEPDQEFCAGYHDRGKVKCWEDIGSPLMCKNANGVWYITGLTSWGGDCFNATEPLVFKDVSKYSAWIKQTMVTEGYAYAH